MLRRYLRTLRCAVDVERVARLTHGLTGADLRELVTRAVLCAGSDDVTTDLLVTLARECTKGRGPGQYP